MLERISSTDELEFGPFLLPTIVVPLTHLFFTIAV
jgi:hypothetical protein